MKYADMKGVETNAGATRANARTAIPMPRSTSVPDGRWLHAGLPKSPSGRNARTTASNTNVKMIE